MVLVVWCGRSESWRQHSEPSFVVLVVVECGRGGRLVVGRAGGGHSRAPPATPGLQSPGFVFRVGVLRPRNGAPRPWPSWRTVGDGRRLAAHPRRRHSQRLRRRPRLEAEGDAAAHLYVLDLPRLVLLRLGARRAGDRGEQPGQWWRGGDQPCLARRRVAGHGDHSRQHRGTAEAVLIEFNQDERRQFCRSSVTAAAAGRSTGSLRRQRSVPRRTSPRAPSGDG